MDKPSLCRDGKVRDTLVSSVLMALVKDTTFQDLSLEIRIIIWNLSLLKHRLVCVGSAYSHQWARSPFSAKPIMANKESYNATLKLCTELRSQSFFDALPGFNPYYDTLFLPAACAYPKALPGREHVRLLRILLAFEAAPRSLAIDTVHCLNTDDILMLLKLVELFIVVRQATVGTRTKILEPGLPVDVGDGLWGRGTKKVQDTRSRVLTEFMEKLQKAAGPGARMPVVKLTVLRRLVGVRDRGALPNGMSLGFSVDAVRIQSKAMRGFFAP
jgi:2EXR family